MQTKNVDILLRSDAHRTTGKVPGLDLGMAGQNPLDQFEQRSDLIRCCIAPGANLSLFPGYEQVARCRTTGDVDDQQFAPFAILVAVEDHRVARSLIPQPDRAAVGHN